MANNRIVLAACAMGLLTGSLAGRTARHLNLRKLLGPNLKLLTRQERTIASALVQQGHTHLFRSWPPPGVKDAEKHRLLQTAATLLGSEVEAARIGLLDAPKAAKKPHTVTAPHGKERVDEYYWLRDDSREDKEMMDYLQAERDYTEAAMADTVGLQETLFKELKGRIKEADESVPIRRGNYLWYTKTLEGEQYTVYVRQEASQATANQAELDKVDPSREEQIILDGNKEARKHSFYMLGSFEVSPDHTKLAYAEDTTGNEKYTLFVKDIATGEQLLSRPIENTAGDVAWASDNKTLFYVTRDEVLRPDKVWRHRIGSDPSEDVVVFHETDQSFNVGVYLSRSEKYIFIETAASVTSEIRWVEAASPAGEFTIVLPRSHDVEYDVFDRGDNFFMLVRDTDRPNSELLIAPISNPRDQKVLLPHRKSVKLDRVIVTAKYAAVFQRENAQQMATTFELPKDGSAPTSLDSSSGRQLTFEEPCFALSAGEQGDFDSEVLRITYSSLTTPRTVIDEHMGTGNRVEKKVAPVLGGFDKNNYKSEREWATAEDGTRVPISLVYRKDSPPSPSSPMLLDAYGSYGICNDPGFDRNALSLIDRGFVFAIAHVRGGGELGRYWYEDGKFKKKKNTFTDFISAAEHLIERKYTNSSRLCIQGRSAGGLTMGAVVNMRPDLFNSAIFGVPFVDVVTTMLDESIPLTTGEFEEWGNPAKEDYYDYMLSYSPVDNIRKAAYPNMLVLAGLHDPRVAYWEPAKFVAKLREHKTNDTLLLFKCDLGAGHFSQSGRFDILKEVALEQAFLLKTQNMIGSQPSSA